MLGRRGGPRARLDRQGRETGPQGNRRPCHSRFSGVRQKSAAGGGGLTGLRRPREGGAAGVASLVANGSVRGDSEVQIDSLIGCLP